MNDNFWTHGPSIRVICHDDKRRPLNLVAENARIDSAKPIAECIAQPVPYVFVQALGIGTNLFTSTTNKPTGYKPNCVRSRVYPATLITTQTCQPVEPDAGELAADCHGTRY